MPGVPKGFLRSLIYLWSSAVSAFLHDRAVSLSILYSSPSNVLPYCSLFTICILLDVSVVLVQPLGLEQSLLAWVLEMVFHQGSYPSLPWQQNSDSHVWAVAGREFPGPLLLVADFFIVWVQNLGFESVSRSFPTHFLLLLYPQWQSTFAWDQGWDVFFPFLLYFHAPEFSSSSVPLVSYERWV